ncbi:uncharacterized protein LOC124936235 isoform X2 [Impatiens glandulifera]|uniref:uncharacterized protein LOC124936235 isoform X2 n=1 Tax=Impatiens glandulifera TaxID=253017 RepID=UPI001FB141A4|nr:uncharacterized protein LOC124936235 isoform X2 [Impatiens glandulifera]
MQALTRWRNFFITASSSSSSSQLASFHSSPILLQKNNKRNNDARREEKPSKDHIRFETRQKRADTKKALKSLLFNGGSPRSTIFQDHTTSVASDHDNANSSNRRNRAKSFSAHRANKEAHQKRMKRKKRRGSFSGEEDEFPGNTFRATFGHKCYTWSFVGDGGFFTENSNNFFEWKEPPKHDDTRQKDWRNESDHESSDDDETAPVENPSSQERILLGLPPLGDITIADVKKVFRLTALKWHPDKHQGPSQGMAEEKFRRCLDAYKYLCGIHSSRLA